MRLAALLLMTTGIAHAGSTYTDLDDKKCKTLSVDEVSGSSTQWCDGVRGYALVVEDSDDRIFVTVVSPDKKKHALDPGMRTGAGFTSLGPRAEWYVDGKQPKAGPTALVYRVREAKPDDSRHTVSRLVVAKITAKELCIVAVIEPTKTQDTDAAKAAAAAPTSPCLETRAP